MSLHFADPPGSEKNVFRQAPKPHCELHSGTCLLAPWLQLRRSCSRDCRPLGSHHSTVTGPSPDLVGLRGRQVGRIRLASSWHKVTVHVARCRIFSEASYSDNSSQSRAPVPRQLGLNIPDSWTSSDPVAPSSCADATEESDSSLAAVDATAATMSAFVRNVHQINLQSSFENLAESLDANVEPVDNRNIIEVCTVWNESELDGRGNSVQSLTMH